MKRRVLKGGSELQKREQKCVLYAVGEKRLPSGSYSIALAKRAIGQRKSSKLGGPQRCGGVQETASQLGGTQRIWIIGGRGTRGGIGGH